MKYFRTEYSDCSSPCNSCFGCSTICQELMCSLLCPRKTRAERYSSFYHSGSCTELHNPCNLTSRLYGKFQKHRCVPVYLTLLKQGNFPCSRSFHLQWTGDFQRQGMQVFLQCKYPRTVPPVRIAVLSCCSPQHGSKSQKLN